MSPIGIRREIADLILEAVDIAVSRKLTPSHMQAFILDVIRAERPDLGLHEARLLVRRAWPRLALGQPAAAPGE